jgi:hypothetical protein
LYDLLGEPVVEGRIYCYPTILCEVSYNGQGCPFVLVDSKSIPRKTLTGEFENVLYSLEDLQD